VTDRVTDDYVQQCLAGDRRLLDAMSEAAARFPEKFAAYCSDRLLPRPLFIGEREIFEFTAGLRTLFRLLTELPRRLYDGDVQAYAAALGIDPRRSAIMRRFPGAPSFYGRADMYHDGTSFKLLELNLGSELGGTDRAEISRALLEVDGFRAFAERHGLGYVHTGQRVAAALRKAAEPLTGGADPVVAFVECDGGLPDYLHLVLSFQEMMRGLGIEVVLGEVGQIEHRGGRVYLHRRPIDVILRYFTSTEIIEDPEGERVVEPIFRAHEEGRVVLWTTLQSGLYANKGCLAMLSDLRAREALTPDEAALVDRMLPWTRALADGPTSADGQTVDLLEYCRDQRAELILKPRANFGGSGIVAGWERTDGEWKEALLAAKNQTYVVQRRVVPRREPVVDPATGELTHWSAAWDAFLTPDGYAGSHIRAVPYGDRAVVNLGVNMDGRTTGVFYHPDR
jgi:hypothetical protein